MVPEQVIFMPLLKTGHWKLNQHSFTLMTGALGIYHECLSFICMFMYTPLQNCSINGESACIVLHSSQGRQIGKNFVMYKTH